MNEVDPVAPSVEESDPCAAEQLLPQVYEELRKLAALKMARERPGQTIGATALVHEAFVRLVEGDRARRWDGRGHFFAAAAEAMRRILIESARRKRRWKHGGAMQRVDLDGVEAPMPLPDEDLLALDEALDRLTILDRRAAGVVKLCFFAGLTQEQAARELGLSLSTTERLWGFARAWLFREVRRARDPGP